MINFIKDFLNFYKFKKNERFFRAIFFNENEFTYSYLKEHIKLRKSPNKLAIISFEIIPAEGAIKTFFFKTNFFRKLFFLTLRINFIYSTTPDLNNSIFLKSAISKNKYIYLQHSPVSLSMIYREKAFINFDMIQAINKHQMNDILDINKIYNKKIKILKSKYLFLENKKKIKPSKNIIDVLIAPTWNTDFYKLNLHKILKKILLYNNKSFELRPHPMSIKNNEISLNDLNKEKIIVNTDKDLNYHNYHYLITDWSGIYIEFALIKNTIPILINTKKKILNENYINFSNTPLEITSRSILGHQIEIEEINNILSILNNNTKKNHTNIINNFYDKNFF